MVDPLGHEGREAGDDVGVVTECFIAEKSMYSFFSWQLATFVFYQLAGIFYIVLEKIANWYIRKHISYSTITCM